MLGACSAVLHYLQSAPRARGPVRQWGWGHVPVQVHDGRRLLRVARRGEGVQHAGARAVVYGEQREQRGVVLVSRSRGRYTWRPANNKEKKKHDDTTRPLRRCSHRTSRPGRRPGSPGFGCLYSSSCRRPRRRPGERWNGASRARLLRFRCQFLSPNPPRLHPPTNRMRAPRPPRPLCPP